MIPISCRSLCIALISVITGCTVFQPSVRPKIPVDAPAHKLLDSVPFMVQAKHQCGPAALAMVLEWSGINVTPEQLVPLVYLPEREGSLQYGLISAARRNGRLAYVFSGMDNLLLELSAGNPVVVLQNLGLRWLPLWHYAVVVGYDLDADCVVLHTGRKAFRKVAIKTFLNTWRRADQWGLCVLKPGAIPCSADEHRYLKASFGLQQANQMGPATKAFQAATLRWPFSVQSHLAFGNVLYANGAIAQAIQAFSKAVEIEPDNSTALNNLAHLLAQSGQLNKAEQMARRAVAIGGVHIGIYQRTLADILCKKSKEKTLTK